VPWFVRTVVLSVLTPDAGSFATASCLVRYSTSEKDMSLILGSAM
jgi:hypothetical protein